MFSASHSPRFSAMSDLRATLPRVGLHTLVHLDSLRRQRVALKGLDARLLNDIGVTRQEADAEAGRSAWDVPGNWRL